MSKEKISRFSVRAFLGKDKKQRREALKEIAYRRRYLVPNLVTLGNMFCGYLAIMYAISDRMGHAFWAIVVALVLDGLDGRVARKLNATSPFGMEFDSFSDLVSFGIAPAVMIYEWALREHAPEFGIFVTFVYLTCAASRLARFNLVTNNLSSFSGLPTPGAAGAVVALIHLLGETTKFDSFYYVCIASFIMTILGLLMVSKITFISIKNFRLQRSHFLIQVLLASLIGLIWYNHRVGLFVIAYAYVLSGPIYLVFSYRDNKLTNNL